MNNTESCTMEDVNQNLYVTMKLNLRYPINELVAWGVFGDTKSLESETFLYSNYSETDIKTASINLEHIKLMNSIEQDIKQFIAKNNSNVDFSTMHSTHESINELLEHFLSKKYEELTSLLSDKNSVFKDYSIWWAYLVIAYREMAIFAFDNVNYYVATQLNEFCRECQAQMVFKNIVFIENYKNKFSAKNKKASEARWQPHREERVKRKRKYLKIMKDKGFSTYSDAATYIKLHVDVDKSPSFNTVSRLLSEADKGNFS